MMKFSGMDTSDKQFFIASIIAPLVVWWVFRGMRKYSTKGMK